ncbi:hypothetical protein [Halarcobacter mediterraneus]|nr:hypothetical protein [Halarcobacter mediterraneus]
MVRIVLNSLFLILIISITGCQKNVSTPNKVFDSNNWEPVNKIKKENNG